MDRRSFLQAGLAASFAGCSKTPTRQAVLEALVREVVAPQVQELCVRSDGLSRAIAMAAADPSDDRLTVARSQWKQAALAWRRASSFRHGPLLDGNPLARAAYFPARASTIERILRERDGFDAAFIETVGGSAKGLYALEYLLFPAEDGQASVFRTAEGTRAGRLAVALASNVAVCAEAVAGALGDGEKFAQAFAGDPHSLERLVNQLIENVENLTQTRLANLLLMADVKRLQAGDVEGFYSRSSHELLPAVLVGSERLYKGGGSAGLADLVRGVRPETDRRIQAAFAEVTRVMRAITEPLDRAVLESRPRLESAVQTCKRLEVALKNELTSSLGITLTFRSMDGD